MWYVVCGAWRKTDKEHEKMKPQSNFTIRKKKDLLEAVNQFDFLPFFANSIPGFSIEEHIAPRIWLLGQGPVSIVEFFVFRKTELWKRKKPPALQVVGIASAYSIKPPMI